MQSEEVGSKAGNHHFDGKIDPHQAMDPPHSSERTI